MNILVACEESQEVCKELRKRGHRAFSCDIQDCSGGHPEWHIQSDVTKLVNGDCAFRLQNGTADYQKGKWDMIIAFPPCTHLAVISKAPIYKKFIGKADLSGYFAEIDRKHKIEEINSQLEKRFREAEKMALYKKLAETDPEVKTLLDELEALK